MFVDMRLKDTTYKEVTIRQRGCDKNNQQIKSHVIGGVHQKCLL